MTKNLGSKLYI